MEKIHYVKLIHYKNATDRQLDEIVVTINHGELGGASATDAPSRLINETDRRGGTSKGPLRTRRVVGVEKGDDGIRRRWTELGSLPRLADHRLN
jgi:uncharacterized membrane protein